jgi:hypothetical protein
MHHAAAVGVKGVIFGGLFLLLSRRYDSHINLTERRKKLAEILNRASIVTKH